MDERQFDLLVFDWDGTLMDSVSSIVACTQQAAADLNLGPVPEENIRHTLGLGLTESMASLGLPSDPELVRRLAERYRHHWLADYCHRSQLFAGAEHTLRGLAERGFLLAVATGKSRRGLERELGATGLAGVFAATRTVDEAPSKPHPRMLEGLLEELGTASAAALMIGDTTHDLDMAANAGTAAVAVLSGSHSREVLATSRALAILDTVNDLPAWLDQRRLQP